MPPHCLRAAMAVEEQKSSRPGTRFSFRRKAITRAAGCSEPIRSRPAARRFGTSRAGARAAKASRATRVRRARGGPPRPARPWVATESAQRKSTRQSGRDPRRLPSRHEPPICCRSRRVPQPAVRLPPHHLDRLRALNDCPGLLRSLLPHAPLSLALAVPVAPLPRYRPDPPYLGWPTSFTGGSRKGHPAQRGGWPWLESPGVKRNLGRKRGSSLVRS